MPSLPGADAKLIKLNPEWTVENAGSTPLEQSISINDFKGKRLVLTLPGAGGFCNKECQVSESDCLGRLIYVEPRIPRTLPDGLVEVGKRVLDAPGNQMRKPQRKASESKIGI